MKLLLSNDDGIDAPGLAALARALEPLGEVWVAAPEREHSAKSHAFTLHKPLRVRPRQTQWFAVSGTPADCVYMGLNHLVSGADIVVSGINRGANLGSDVFYSGTVAGAMEATLQGVPSVAISLDRRPDDSALHWDTAGAVARRVVEQVLAQTLPSRTFLNVNVPNVAAAELRGVRATTLGSRSYTKRVDERTDPFGRKYYWIGGQHQMFGGEEGSDGVVIQQGYATVTPLQPNLTREDFLAPLSRWFDA